MTIKGYSNITPPVTEGLLTVSSHTYSQVNKIKGGIFGYRDVETKFDTNGNKITNCEKPGIRKCVAALVVNDNPLSTEEAEALDRYITGLITPEHTSGTVLYNEVYVITYQYSIEQNGFTYSVYSLDSAAENGIVW
jgi:hypothetical protein